ncbi:unnamed protein product [Chrysodeixis includens]|uniref:Uncharacterized protein n=1 Tax=Chrysodeixis includens TaxID=689277 RepID=A0A9P0C7S2_CHRIL|nr:unnamed protein product [Chrysodeixis includens]
MEEADVMVVARNDLLCVGDCGPAVRLVDCCCLCSIVSQDGVVGSAGLRGGRVRCEVRGRGVHTTRVVHRRCCGRAGESPRAPRALIIRRRRWAARAHPPRPAPRAARPSPVARATTHP